MASRKTKEVTVTDMGAYSKTDYTLSRGECAIVIRKDGIIDFFLPTPSNPNAYDSDLDYAGIVGAAFMYKLKDAKWTQAMVKEFLDMIGAVKKEEIKAAKPKRTKKGKK